MPSLGFFLTLHRLVNLVTPRDNGMTIFSFHPLLLSHHCDSEQQHCLLLLLWLLLARSLEIQVFELQFVSQLTGDTRGTVNKGDDDDDSCELIVVTFKQIRIVLVFLE